jgi:hypothetical protein
LIIKQFSDLKADEIRVGGKEKEKTKQALEGGLDVEVTDGEVKFGEGKITSNFSSSVQTTCDAITGGKYK